MSDLKDKFYGTLSKAKKQLTDEVKSQGYYDDGFSYWFRSWRVVIFPLAMIIAAVVSLVFMEQIALGATFGGLAILSFLFSIGKYPLSEYGQDMKNQLEMTRFN